MSMAPAKRARCIDSEDELDDSWADEISKKTSTKKTIEDNGEDLDDYWADTPLPVKRRKAATQIQAATSASLPDIAVASPPATASASADVADSSPPRSATNPDADTVTTGDVAAATPAEPAAASDTLATAVPEAATAAPVASPSDASATEKAERVIDTMTVLVGNISFSVAEDQFELDFSEHGEIRRLKFLEGHAYITYESTEGVSNALKFDGDEYWGRVIKVERATKRTKQMSAPAPEFEAFIKNLPKTATEEAVRKRFAECGEIDRLRVPLNGENEVKGVAFITFKTEADLENALKLHDANFDDKPMVVEKAKGKGKGKGKRGEDKKGKGKGKGKSKGKGKGKGNRDKT